MGDPTDAIKKTRNPDLFVRHLCEHNANMLVPHILMAAYLYYVLDRPLLQDDTFDWMCNRLLWLWDIAEHEHKHLISRDDLRAGTGYAFKYPERVKGAAEAMARRFTETHPQPTREARKKRER